MASRRSRPLAVAGVALAAIGLAASLASLVDALGPAPTFCAEGGCAIARASAWSHPLGVPMPVLGVGYFAAMLALGFGRPAWPRARLAVALVGAAWAGVLIGVQAIALGAWCKLCMIADPAAIALAGVVAAGAGAVTWTWRRGAILAPAVAAIVVGLGVFAHPAAPPPLPAGTPAFVAREQSPGTATVVEVVDFECPFCRALAPTLHEAIARAHAPVRVVRKMVPLPMHAHAMAAAIAWCCADAQGKGDAMADALFAAPPDELTPDGCERIAARVGCDLGRYRLDAPAAMGHVAADLLDARGAGVHHLPTVFYGGECVVGAGATADELVAKIDRAVR